NNDGTYAVVNHAKPAVIRIQGFFFRAHESARGALMDDMCGLPVDEDMCKAAQEAAAAWTSLAEQLAARAAPATEAKAPEPEPAPVVENPWVPPAPATTADDYPDMPDCIRRAPRGVAA